MPKAKVVCRFAQPSVIHRLGHCNECEEQFDLFMDANGEKEMKKHILDTGHSVSVETGSFNVFSRHGG